MLTLGRPRSRDRLARASGIDPHAGRTARVMGTRGELVVGAGSDRVAQALVADAFALVDELEQLWSRFRHDSDVTRLNESAGTFVAVDRRTLELLERADDARVSTEGLFSPLAGRSVIANGYRLPWQDNWAARAVSVPSAEGIALDDPGIAIEVDRDGAMALVPSGYALDLGGIAKGHAADLVVGRLAEAGARWASVDLGGDIALFGGDGEVSWSIAIDDPQHFDCAATSEPLGLLTLGDGGVATSSSARRRWDVVDGRGTRPRHHVLDPRTGAPTDGPVQVTVVAGRAGDAEVLTKVGMVGGVDALRPWLVAGVEAYVVGSANVLVPVGASPQPSASRTG